MYRWIARVGAALALLAVAGCIDVTTVVKVRKDGGGEIVQTVFMSPALAGMMGGMTQALGGQAGAAQKPPSLVDETKLKADAAKMGEGVAFVSAQEVTKEDGSKGVRATYSYADVTKLTMSPTSGMDGMNPAGGGGGQAEEKKQPFAFEFAKGEPAKLTIKMPPDEPAKGATPGTTNAPMPDVDLPASATDTNSPAAAMMKQMFEGMRIRYYVMVNGEITDTNASYVEEHKKTGKKQFVTLLDIDFGAIMKNPEKFKKLSAMGPTEDPMKMKALLKDFPGVKIETAKVVNVSFK